VAVGYLSESFPFLLELSPYVAIFLLLIGGIWVIPFAEEIALAAAGYLYYSGEVQLVTMLSVAGAGVFLGDFFAFWLGRHFGRAQLQRALNFIGSHRWLGFVGAFLDRYGMWALFWARFLPGMRLPAHVLVGMHGMSTVSYVWVSLLSIVVYVPVIFALAYSFGEEIEAGLHALKNLGHVTWGLFLLVIGVWLAVRFLVSKLALTSRKGSPS
jgi:membrane protein DedA with SNARE-associated domain